MMKLSVLLLVTYLLLVQYTVNGQTSVQLLSQATNTQLPNITILSASQFLGGTNQGLTCSSNYTIETTPPNIGQWYDPRGSEIMTDFRSIYRLRGPGSVTLYRSIGLEGQEGIYTCTIPDTTGRIFTLYAGIYTDTSYTNGKPVLISTPKFNLLTSLSNYPPSFTITCSTSSFPPTYVNWTRDGSLVEDNGGSYTTYQVLKNASTSTFDSVLMIQESFLAGEYNCTVSNSRDQSTGSYTVRAPSGPPTNISSEFLGAGDVRITWTPPGGFIDGYQVSYQQVNGSDNGVNITGPGEDIILRSLRAAATYSIKIMAYADLPTQFSDDIEITLNVAGSPENITVDPSLDNATILSVSWEEPVTGSTNVVGYIVEYEPSNDGPNNCPGIAGGSVQTTNTSTIITGLQEYTKYSITVRTISTAAVGEPSNPLNGTTTISSPSGPPLDVTVTSINPDMINITWEPPLCSHQNGPIIQYRIHRVDLTFDFTDKPINVSSGFLVMLTNLVAFRNFSFSVEVQNRNGSFMSNVVYGHLIGVPGQVEGLAPTLEDLTSIELEWDAPRQSNLILPDFFTRDFNYSIEWYRTPRESQSRGALLGRGITQSVRRFKVENLLPGVSYRLFVYAISSYGQEETGRFIDRETGNISQVVRVGINEVNSSSVNVTWSPLSSPDVILYRIYYNSSIEQETVVLNISGYQSSLFPLNNLDNSATYYFRVAAVVNTTENGFIEGPLSNRTTFTFTQHSNLRLILIVTGGTVGGIILLVVIIAITVIILTILNRSIGPQLAVKGEEGYRLIPLKTTQQSDTMTTPTDGRPTLLETPPKEIHAVEGQEVVLRVHFHGNPTLSWKHNDEEIDWENATFSLRDGIILFPYVEIEHSGRYQVSAQNDHGSEMAVIELTVYPEMDLVQIPPKEEEVITSAKIPLVEFGQYVASFHGNNNRKFREQFKRLSVPNIPIEVAWDEDNHVFNRNQSIVVYDSNRIELEPLVRFLDCQHKYINACYIIGEDNEEYSNKFIATQGPLDRTVVDFWRMVWQEKACAIVMLTNLQEDLRIKCSQYWPSKGSEDYGPYTVTLIRETIHAGYIVREMTVHYNTMIGNLRSKLVNPTGKVDTNKKEYFSVSQSTLVLTQYHYIDWPEHSYPKSISSLLSLHRLVVTGTEKKKGPIVVHCSNGAGRSGAYIAMDMALKQAGATAIIDIPSIVDTLRQQRMMMIQTLDQYVTVHDAVLEQVLCGNTQILANELRNVIQSLSMKDKEGKNGFHEQYEVLEQISINPVDASCDVARHNMRKNRNTSILPIDQWRVPLKGESQDYINACFIPGYKNDKSFIIAQSPLRETRRDFWKMVFDREITTIIMLSPIVEEGEEVCSQYWPKDGNIEFNEFTVSVKEEWSHDGFSRKLLLVRDTKNNIMRRLAQFQVSGWSQDGVTSCGIPSIVNTINLVKTVQRKNPHIPILVHCSNMIGRSAMFCAAMATIEQMKSVGVADIFQVVKAMRTHLPGAIESKVQYEMIHLMAASYIDLFSTTANF